MNLRKLCLLSIVVLLVCQLGFAQTSNASRAIAIVKATGKATPVLPAYLAKGPTHPTIWLSRNLGVKSKLVAGEPSFCDYGSGSQIAVCAKGVQTAYGTNFLGANGGAGMTIAIVDFFAYSGAEAQLAQFNSDMGLPACTTANGCFHSVALTNIDGTGTGWDLESMLDLEYAHAMAPNAKIVYVQGDPYGDPGYYAESIAALGCPASPYCSMYSIASSPAGDVVSNSWTYNAGEAPADDPNYNLGKPLLFASGDDGAWPYTSVTGYPCTSVYSTCVGGTALYLNPNLTRNVETGWSGGGGGCSNNFAIPSWQGSNGSGICSPNRAAPDIAAIADGNNTPVAVWICNSYWGCYYYGVGGTSVATPVMSGLVADINTARVSFGKAKLTSFAPGLYPAAAGNYNYFFYDVTSGNNGFAAGYQFDLVTGLGVPTGKDLANKFYGLP